MTTQALPGKGGDKMMFGDRSAMELWGRQKKDPEWHLTGNQLHNGRGNKLKLVDGKWVSA